MMCFLKKSLSILATFARCFSTWPFKIAQSGHTVLIRNHPSQTHSRTHLQKFTSRAKNVGEGSSKMVDANME